jgi:hypothetical protein
MLKMVPSARRLSLLVCLAAVAGLSSFAATAGAVGSIERVWSFQEGAVDVVSQSSGDFIGVVSVATKFARCVHPIDEQMWIEMRPQPDGSYWGLHRWYYETCVPNPTYGPTAWRVIENQRKEEVLRVCFSAPESGSQPTIAPDGTHAHATYGCVDSQPITEVPAATPFARAVVLPAAKSCVRLHSLTIKLRNPKYDPLKQVVVWVNGKKIANLRGAKKLKHAIRLKHLPNGRFTVKVLAVTVLNHRLTGSRTYMGCGGASGDLKLHHGHKKHRHKHG